MKKLLTLTLFVLASSAIVRSADAPKPLKILLITGGCCHDYKVQKDILKKGLETRANVVVDQIHTDDKSTKPDLNIYGNAEYAKGYDLVIHDECASDINGTSTISRVLQPHRDGIPGVNLHCAMHSYRFGDYSKPVPAGADNAQWYEYLGLQSIRHGAQLPIEITFATDASPITKGLQNWKTVNEELYNNIKVWDDAKALARGKQGAGDKPGENDTVVVWTNEYGAKKARVFSTTIGHNNATVEDPRYLDLVARGVLWACDKLDADGKPKAGYGPGGK
jgi:type 1 glutamine amidotransferase